MRQLTPYIFGLLLLTTSCGQTDNNTSTATTVDSITVNTDTLNIQKNNVQSLTPQTTPLPFGLKRKSKEWYNDDLSFYPKLITKDSTLMDFDTNVTPKYSLPSIKKIKYIHIDSREDYICNNGQPVDSLWKLTKYRYRLPNIAQYESYYMCGCNYNNNDYSEVFWSTCPAFAYTCYGYLILYDTLTKQANVLDIYFTKYRDGTSVQRCFYIDNNYHIELFAYGIGEDEGDKSFPLNNESFDILISKTGDISVTKK